MPVDMREEALRAADGAGDDDINDVVVNVEEVATRAAREAATYAAQEVADRVVEQLPRKRGMNGQKRSLPTKPGLSRLFPTQGEEILVKKRSGEFGNYKTSVIGQYTASDVMASKTIEGFLLKYVVPKRGGGEYVVSLVGSDGAVRTESTFTLESADEPVLVNIGQNDPKAEVNKLLLDLYGWVQGKKANVSEKNEALDLLKQLQTQNVHGGQSEMTKYLMERLDRAERKDEDSMEKAILTKLLTRLDKIESVPPPPAPMIPLPPPVPQVDVGQVVAHALEKVFDRFAQMQATQQQNQMSMRDMLELVERMRPPPPLPLPPPPKEKSVFEQMMEFAQVKQTLFGDKDNQVELLKQQNDNLKDELREIRQALKEPADPLDQIKSVIEMNDTLEQLSRRRKGGDGMGAMVRDIFGGVTDMARETNKVLVNQRHLAKEATKAVQTRQQSRPTDQEKPWPYPQSFRPYFDAVKNANDDFNRIYSTLKAFQNLGETSPSWKPYFEKAFTLAKEDKQRETLGYLRAFLNNLTKTGEISSIQVETIMTAFERNWDSMRSRLFAENMPEDMPEEEDETATIADSSDSQEDEQESEAVTQDETEDKTPQD